MTRLVYSPHFRSMEPVLVSATIAAYAACVWIAAAWFQFVEDPVVRYAVSFIVVQLAIQSILILGLVVSKHVRTSRETARTARKRQMEELLTQSGSTVEALEMARQWPTEFLAVVDSAMQALSGSARRRIAELLVASSPYRSLLGETVGSDPSRAIRAIMLLGKLENPEARSAVRQGLKHPAEAARRAARKAVVAGGTEDAQREVLARLYTLPFWERIILFQLAPANSTLLTFLAEAVDSSEDEHVLVALEFVLTRQRLMPFRVPARLAQSSNLEIRIKFFRALPFLRLEEDVSEVLAGGLNDGDWRVRALAAKACGSLRADEFVGRLIEMCGTFDNPAEAGHAARALAALGGEGWSRLQQVISLGSGAGRRIATEVVERRMVGGQEVSR